MEKILECTYRKIYVMQNTHSFKLADSVALDRLYKEMIEYFSLKENLIHWSQQRETFVERVTEDLSA